MQNRAPYARPGGYDGGYDRAGPEQGGEEECPPFVRRGLCGLLAVVALGIFCASSLAAVPPLHYAIKYNQFTKSADTDSVMGPGRYFIGPFSKFLIFPSTVQNIEFTNIPEIVVSGARNPSLSTRTKEALSVDIHVSLQYRLPKDKIADLYKHFNLNYESVFVSAVRDTLLDSVAEFKAQDLWLDRKSFQKKMQELVDKKLKDSHAECWSLQMLILDLPDDLEDRLVHTQVQSQQIVKTQKEQTALNISAQTDRIESDYDKNVTVIRAHGTADKTLAMQQAQAQANKKRIDTEKDVLNMLKTTLGVQGEHLIPYQRFWALEDMEASNLVYGFGGAQVLIGSKGGGTSR